MAQSSLHVKAESTLNSIADELLFQEDEGKLRHAAQQLYEFFLKVAGDSFPSEVENSLLPNGKALSPGDAARCVLDYARTSKFLRGVYAALQKALGLFPNQRLEVVYAGCGPFATLVVPLLTRLDPARVGFTLIDIHQQSLESVSRIIETIGAGDYVKAYRQADATTYSHDAPIQLLIVETMQRALTVEPQVAVTLNLAKQLAEGGILIPEEVSVELICVDLTQEFSPSPRTTTTRVNLGAVLQLSQASAFRIEADNSFVARIVEVPEIDRRLTFSLYTKLKIFDEIELGHYESGISFPLPLHDLYCSTTSNHLELVYQLSANPGFKYRWLD